MSGWRQAMRLTFTAGGIVVCAMATYGALRMGLSRSLAEFGLRTGSLAAATEAVRLGPDDPEAYRARAESLAESGEYTLAVEDLRRAITLRPNDYNLWSQLGRALDLEGNTVAALAAFDEAEGLAPFYAITHLDKGKLLLRSGRRDEAFKEFSSATLSRPALFKKVIEIAWNEYGGDCAAIERAVSPRDLQERFTLANFFVEHGKAAEVANLLRNEKLSSDERLRVVSQLLEAREFAGAYEIWAAGLGRTPNGPARGNLDDGGFEAGAISDAVGFGWRMKEDAAFRVSIDNSERHSGSSSLRIDWKGNPAASDSGVSQLLMVEPNTHYRLYFVVRAQNLVTGGAPIVEVDDVTQDEKRLGQSSQLTLGTTGWENRSVEFMTTTTTSAVRIALQRENCPDAACPIFGSLWLDDFSLNRANGAVYQ